uniref:Uncharacterized protein n=1 Tax=Nelumbo nucifera TaxID=4432 RepID=A0A822Z4T0_NELNU|nr:TPA_asm: hypothetical protein HUJ06_009116 [Nelumbo nucifera]
MGGTGNRKCGSKGKKAASSLFSIFSIFKSKRPQIRDDAWEDRVRVYPSDGDKKNWVAEPGIDIKASVYIANFYKTHVSADPDCQTLNK